MSRRLVIGNRVYSSWSLRAWLACRMAGQPFETVMIPLDGPEFAAARPSLPAGRVPVLHDGDATVWDSLAIIEYLAETAPLWPEDRAARAHARAISAEMHSGFADLRRLLPMNTRRAPRPVADAELAAGDIERIAALWEQARACYGAYGPYLFGRWSAADCMFAPVASRFTSYAVPLPPVADAYRGAVMAHPHMAEWVDDAARETLVLAREER